MLNFNKKLFFLEGKTFIQEQETYSNELKIIYKR